jgi:hypothetical protein
MEKSLGVGGWVNGWLLTGFIYCIPQLIIVGWGDGAGRGKNDSDWLIAQLVVRSLSVMKDRGSNLGVNIFFLSAI